MFGKNKSKKPEMEDIGEYTKNYSEDGLFDKVTGAIKKAGLATIYKALQLYYVTERPDCPAKLKAAILGTLGYFILPIDLIPDIAPVVGYTDDAATIAATITMAQWYIDDEVIQKAQNRLQSFFGPNILEQL